MNPDNFAEWFRRQGQQVFWTQSSYWCYQGSGAYQAFPYHWIIYPPEQELAEFLMRNKGLALRYSTGLEYPLGSLSYHAVYESSAYNMDSLGRWARKNVRRGLKSCVVEPISFARLAEEGWELQIDTLARQGRKLEVARDSWRKRCLAAADLPGFEAWGALVDGCLAASVITFQMDNCCYMLYQQCRREFLPAHVNNALSFRVTETMIGRPSIHSILYGLHSLDAPASVDEFKFRMGYTAKPVRQRVVFHPWVVPLANPVSHAVLKRMVTWQPGRPTLSKAEGMMRFYLQGKLPMLEQPVPEPLQDHNNDPDAE